jgi:phage FluMu protein Com
MIEIRCPSLRCDKLLLRSGQADEIEIRCYKCREMIRIEHGIPRVIAQPQETRAPESARVQDPRGLHNGATESTLRTR